MSDGAGETTTVTMHDGSTIVLKKVGPDHDPTNRYAAMKLLEDAKREKHFITGLIYVDEERETLPEQVHIGDNALAHLTEAELRPSRDALAKVMADLG